MSLVFAKKKYMFSFSVTVMQVNFSLKKMTAASDSLMIIQSVVLVKFSFSVTVMQVNFFFEKNDNNFRFTYDHSSKCSYCKAEMSVTEVHFNLYFEKRLFQIQS